MRTPETLFGCDTLAVRACVAARNCCCCCIIGSEWQSSRESGSARGVHMWVAGSGHTSEHTQDTRGSLRVAVEVPLWTNGILVALRVTWHLVSEQRPLPAEGRLQ